MPLYEYRCVGCDQTFETLRGIHEKDEAVACPRCGAKKAERLLSVCSAVKGESPPSSTNQCGAQKFT